MFELYNLYTARKIIPKMTNPPETPDPNAEKTKLSLQTEMIEDARRSQALPFRKSPLRKDIKKSPINWRNRVHQSVPHGS